MITMPQPLVTCEVCEYCTCLCAKTAKDILLVSENEASDLLLTIEKIKGHEDYLRQLRQELEREARRVLKPDVHGV